MGQLDTLCLGAKSDCQHQVEPAERNSTDFLWNKGAIDLIAQKLLDAGEAESIAELEIQAQVIDPNSLPRRNTELSNKVDDDLEPGCTDLAEIKRRKEK